MMVEPSLTYGDKFDEEGNPVDDPRIPLDYLESLFGTGVGPALALIEAERAKKKRGEESDLMDTLIARNWLDLFGPFTNSPKEVAEKRAQGAKASTISFSGAGE